MLVIRLSRQGKKKFPVYKVIISEKHKDTQGDYLEALGLYNPHKKEIDLNKERIEYWLSKGAQVSDTVHNLFVNQKILEKAKRRKGQIKKKVKEGEEDKVSETGEKAESEKKPAPAKEEAKTEKAEVKEEKKPKDLSKDKKEIKEA